MAFKRLLNSVHETHIVFENLSNINRDMLQKASGLNIGEGGRHSKRQLGVKIICELSKLQYPGCA